MTRWGQAGEKKVLSAPHVPHVCPPPHPPAVSIHTLVRAHASLTLLLTHAWVSELWQPVILFNPFIVFLFSFPLFAEKKVNANRNSNMQRKTYPPLAWENLSASGFNMKIVFHMWLQCTLVWKGVGTHSGVCYWDLIMERLVISLLAPSPVTCWKVDDWKQCSLLVIVCSLLYLPHFCKLFLWCIHCYHL